MKHTAEALAQYQLLSLESKIQFTKKRINQWVNYYGVDNVYLSYSGGKDSTVLKHIIESMGLKISNVFVNTGLEYPEIVRFVKTFDNVEIIRPKMPFNEVLLKYGYPVVSKEQSSYIKDVRESKSEKLRNLRLYGRNGSYKISEKHKYLIKAPFKISDKCCTIMKKNPTKDYEKRTNKKPFIATTCEESRLRFNSWLKYGCNGFEKTRPTSTPLSIWTEQDILKYIYIYKLKIASIYGDVIKVNDKYQLTGVKRTGCMFCMYGVQHEDPTNNRFIQMQKTHPKQYKYCMEKLGLDAVLNYMKIPH